MGDFRRGEVKGNGGWVKESDCARVEVKYKQMRHQRRLQQVNCRRIHGMLGCKESEGGVNRNRGGKMP